jgi:hypothetical protein
VDVSSEELITGKLKKGYKKVAIVSRGRKNPSPP